MQNTHEMSEIFLKIPKRLKNNNNNFEVLKNTKFINRRPAKGQKSLQKIVLMAFFSTSKQLCQIFSTKITNDDVGVGQSIFCALGVKLKG